MRINMNQWIAGILAADKRLALPILTFPAIQLAHSTVREAVQSGERQFKLMRCIAERYPDMPASVTNMDLSVEAEEFGANVRYADDETPTVVGRLIADIEDVPALTVPPVGTGRTAEHLKAVELAAAHITDRPVLAGCIGPISLAGRLLDMNEIMLQLRLEPELTHTLLEKCTDFLLRYALAFKESGANGLVIAEPAAGLLSAKQCDEFSSAYVRRIVSAVQDKNFLVVLHNCGNTQTLVPSLLSTGASCLHFGNAVKMKEIMPQIPEGILAMGNINPTTCFLSGSTVRVVRETQNLLEDMAPYRNFVLSSGCDIPPSTPIENVDAFFAALRRYNAAAA